ncbi:MAG: hypothetical protein JWO60_257 [Frankiales bacterium]|nr:hypothetical protein [Frankiales bacterium]
MSETPAGRRGNGLQAADWGALVDLDPRLAEGLLDRLASAGVPAYVEPASAAGDPWPRAPLPCRPLDRLWVDPDRAEAAREVVTAELADLSALLAEGSGDETPFGLVQPVPRHAARRVLPPPPLPEPPAAPTLDDDELFRQIVAGFDSTPDDAVPRWPVAEEAGPSPDGSSSDSPTPDLGAARRRPPPVDRAPRRRRADEGLPAWLEPDALEPDPDDIVPDDHFVPPPPPPAGWISLRSAGAVALVVLGLVLLFVPQLVGQGATSGVLLLGIALLGGGAAALVLRVRDAPPHDTGPDDGAVV